MRSFIQRLLIAVCSLSVLAGAAAAQSRPPLQVPLLGFVYEHDIAGVRPILGIPGASVLGETISLPDDVAKIHFAPGQRYALAERNTGSLAALPLTATSAGPLVEIDGALSSPELVRFSPNGGSALIWSSVAGKLQIIAGLPDAPRLAREIDRAELPGDVRTLAVADDAHTVLEGTEQSEIYLVSGTGPEFLYAVDDLAGVVFASGSDNALVIDRAGGVASLLRHVTSGPSHEVIGNGLTGLTGEVGLQIDAHTAMIAGAESTDLWKIDLQTLQAEDVQLPASPTRLQPLVSAGRFLLSYKSGEPAWIFDAASGVHFVPARRPQ